MPRGRGVRARAWRAQGLRLAGVGVLLAVVAACSSVPPDWSIVPGTPAAPGAAASPSAAVGSTAPGAAPSPGSTAGTPPAGSASAPAATGATVLDLTAKNIAFDQSSLTAAANTPLTIHFDNQDAGVGHDVAIYQGSASGTQEFQGQVIVGPSTVDYQVPALAPGTYTLLCIVHPTQMVATLTVK